jgi:hypothetical protein
VPEAAGGGEILYSNADLAALPPELAKQSLTSTSVILPLDAAISAITILVEKGRLLEGWEGWVKLHDGTRAKSLSHGGSFALSRDPARAAETAAAGMRRAQQTWERNPEHPGGSLYFGLSFGAAS